jgi:hypothetical protein
LKGEKPASFPGNHDPYSLSLMPGSTESTLPGACSERVAHNHTQEEERLREIVTEIHVGTTWGARPIHRPWVFIMETRDRRTR